MQTCFLENDLQNYESLKVELGNKVDVVDKLKMKMVENWKAKAKAFDASQKKVINKSKMESINNLKAKRKALDLGNTKC